MLDWLGKQAPRRGALAVALAALGLAAADGTGARGKNRNDPPKYAECKRYVKFERCRAYRGSHYTSCVAHGEECCYRETDFRSRKFRRCMTNRLGS